MNKKTICATLLIVLSLNSHVVFASPKENQKVQQQINSTNIQKTEEKVQILDDKIQNSMIAINNNKTKISKIEKNIIDMQDEINKMQKEVNSYHELYKERTNTLYINGNYSYIVALLDSKGFGDFMLRLETIKKIILFDKQIMEECQLKLDTITIKKKELEEKKTELVSIQEKNEEKLKFLKKSKAKQKSILASYRPIIVNQEKANKILSSISSNKGSVSRGRNISSSAIVSYATNFLGTPYVWGGTSKKGFDCSGFTQYVYGHFDINLPRLASEQQKIGYGISISDLQPGDLVFVGCPAHHVGIYAGNGYMIHAPQTGDVVKLSPIDSNSNARRLK